MKTAQLLVDAHGPEIRHRTGLTAPDAFIYLRLPEGDTVLFDAREYGIQEERLKAIGNKVAIERLEPYIEIMRAMSGPQSKDQKLLLAVLQAKGITGVEVSESIPYGLAKVMQDAGIAVSIRDFARELRYKTEHQMGLMTEAQRVTEGAFSLAREMLRKGVIDGDRILLDGQVLTSERMKAALKTYFLERGYSNPHGMVIASGEQSARPHDDGRGPILPNTFIVIDIFPQNDESGFHADMTRTFVKGEASDEMKAVYDAVRDVQAEIADYVEAGVRCADVYARTVEAFKVRGYETSPERGFMHRTGHGLGLSVHEEPSFNVGFDDVMEPGMAMSVEPGLYYPGKGYGGVRIEDTVVIHPDGRKENLNLFDKEYLIP